MLSAPYFALPFGDDGSTAVRGTFCSSIVCLKRIKLLEYIYSPGAPAPYMGRGAITCGGVCPAVPAGEENRAAGPTT